MLIPNVKISFWEKDQLDDVQKRNLFEVKISQLIALGYDMSEFDENDVIYLDTENYKRFLAIQYNDNVKPHNTEEVEDINNKYPLR